MKGDRFQVPGVGKKRKPFAYPAPDTRHPSPLLRLGWLLPVTYAAHIYEEWRGGFPAWWSRLTGARMSPEMFLGINKAAFVAMTVAVVVAYLIREMRWLFVAFGTVVLINAAAHLVASAVTFSYSPGAATGALLWLPLGALVLRAGWRGLTRRSFTAGALVGVALHACVTLTALYAAR